MSKSDYTSGKQSKDMNSGEDWSSIQDPDERRRVQNRLAQRKFRDKIRQQKEDTERSEENQRRAGGSYRAAEPKDLDTGKEDGLPWGSLSLKHSVTKGRTAEQSSKDTSMYESTTRAGGGSRRLTSA